MADRKGILIRIGIDATAGAWNCPIDPDTREFVYIPIPEKASTQFQVGMRRPYAETAPSLTAFCNARVVQNGAGVLPGALANRCMHLDPDFEHLTYGDLGSARGKRLRELREDDLIVFYAGLRPCRGPNTLVYALVGMFLVDHVAPIGDVDPALWCCNAHTRKLNHGASDVIVWAKPQRSGRFAAAIPFGDYRDSAYRIREDVLEAWGGISAKNGFIQRSGVLPWIGDADACLHWINSQGVKLEQRNF